ncbi:hypothetical protein Tco_0595811 [Tanacetum coccineum]
MQKLNSFDEIISLEHHLNELKKSNRLEDDYNNTSTVLRTRLDRLIKVKEVKGIRILLEPQEKQLILLLRSEGYASVECYVESLDKFGTFLRTVLMVDSITFGQGMVNILVSGEEYDKVFNHLDMLNAPLEGKVFTTDIQEKDKKKAKNDQTKHGMEKTKSNRSQSQSKST